MSSLLRRNKLAAFGFIVICSLTFVALFAPWIMPYDPSVQDLASRLLGRPGIILLETMSWAVISFPASCWGPASVCGLGQWSSCSPGYLACSSEESPVTLAVASILS
jgi:ABC-type dipeptide/oligopeptide/nickel transport system permease subunit